MNQSMKMNKKTFQKVKRGNKLLTLRETAWIVGKVVVILKEIRDQHWLRS